MRFDRPASSADVIVMPGLGLACTVLMKKPKKARRAEPIIEPEETPPAETQAPEESSPEAAVVRGGARGALVGGLLGGAGGVAAGGVLGLMGSALQDGDEKKPGW